MQRAIPFAFLLAGLFLAWLFIFRSDGKTAPSDDAAARDLLWVNALLQVCQEPDFILDDLAGEANALGIVDRAGSGQGLRQLFTYACFRVLRELAGQDEDALFPKTKPALPPGCEAT